MKNENREMGLVTWLLLEYRPGRLLLIPIVAGLAWTLDKISQAFNCFRSITKLASLRSPRGGYGAAGAA